MSICQYHNCIYQNPTAGLPTNQLWYPRGLITYPSYSINVSDLSSTIFLKNTDDRKVLFFFKN